jgi:uridine phosphorylase
MVLGRHTCLPWFFDDPDRVGVPALAALGRLPPSILLVGDRRRVSRVRHHLEQDVDVAACCAEALGGHAAGRVAVGFGVRRGVPVLVVETQMGGPATEIITREVLDPAFHPTPPQALIRVGSCGVLADLDPPPELVVASFAAGWSGALAQATGGVLATCGGAEVPEWSCSPDVIEALDDGVAKAPADLDTATGGVLSKDSLYAEQAGGLSEAMADLGCVATEMELATIGPLAESLGVPWGGILASVGWVPGGAWFDPARVARNEDAAIDAALEALCLLAEGGAGR